MPKQKLNNQNNLRQEKKEGYIIIPNYFLREYIKVLGVGPVMFYQYLLTYCHKNKNTAWPSLSTSSKDTGITKKTLTKYYRILIQYGLIKKFSKKKLSSDGYMRNIYQLTPLNGEKITLHKGNFYHNIGVKITPDLGKNLPPNNTNLNITNVTTAKGGKDAVAAVNFKKLKEKGDLSACLPERVYSHTGNAQAEEKMQTPYNSKEHYKGQAIKERMIKLDFMEVFIEKILKEYSVKKIDEKLDLLLERKNIQNPPAWLSAALKNDYRDPHSPNVIANDRRECGNPKHVNLNSQIPSPLEEEGEGDCRGRIHPTRLEPDKNILSHEEAAKRFKLLRHKLMAMN